MLHTSGFPRAPFGAARLGRPRAPARGVREVAAATGSRAPRFEYHPTSAHWVLAELIERVDRARLPRRSSATRILEPLGLTALQLGVPPATQADINELVATRRAGDARRARGRDRHPRAAGHRGHDRRAARRSTSPRCARSASPAAAASRPRPTSRSSTRRCSTTRSGIWEPEVLADVTADVRNTFPDSWAAREPRRSASSSRATTGTPTGAAWATRCRPARSATTAPAARSPGPTPTTGLSFCYLTNGLDQNALREGRRGDRHRQPRRRVRRLRWACASFAGSSCSRVCGSTCRSRARACQWACEART